MNPEDVRTKREFEAYKAREVARLQIAVKELLRIPNLAKRRAICLRVVTEWDQNLVTAWDSYCGVESRKRGPRTTDRDDSISNDS